MTGAGRSWHGFLLMPLFIALGGLVLIAMLSIGSAQLNIALLLALIGGVAGLLFPVISVYASVCATVFVGLLRRIAGGADAYVAADPLIALPALIMIQFAVSRSWRRTTPSVARNAQVILIVVNSILAIVNAAIASQSLLPILKGWVEQSSTILFGLAVTSAGLSIYQSHLFRALRYTSLLAAIYGWSQAFAPFSWDLAWLANRQGSVSSFGAPIPGQFRLFGPMTSPLAFAVLLGLGIIFWIFSDRAMWARLVAATLLLVPLSLTGVRTVVFALVLAIALTLILRGNWKISVPAVLLGASIPVWWGALIRYFPIFVDRFSLHGLSDDVSFQARLELLIERWPSALTSVGSGPGGSMVGSSVVDNGYLAVFLELGLVGGIVFCGLVVWALSNAVSASRSQFHDDRIDIAASTVFFFSLCQASAPVIQGFLGLFFWVSVGILDESSRRISPQMTLTGADGPVEQTV